LKTFPAIFTGIFATFALGWAGAVMIPQFQLGGLQPQVDEEMGDIYPINVGGVTDQGRRVYASEGCFYCHSQQVRGKFDGSDIERGWGGRRTVARDYIYDDPIFLGSMRKGPDLANAGARTTKPESFYRELYDPRGAVPGSTMPSYRYLFTKRKISGQRSVDALDLAGPDAPEPGYEIVPTGEAKALVGYLLSLDRNHALKEVPQEAKKK